MQRHLEVLSLSSSPILSLFSDFGHQVVSWLRKQWTDLNLQKKRKQLYNCAHFTRKNYYGRDLLKKNETENKHS